MELSELAALLRQSWSAETAMGAWSPENPPLNQCGVTALVVQDMFGGALLRCKMSDGGSHYWNRLPYGAEVDLTAAQFQHLAIVLHRETTEERTRQRVLRYPDTMRRYGILLVNLSRNLVKK